jgi:hypothetical protein
MLLKAVQGDRLRRRDAPMTNTVQVSRARTIAGNILVLLTALGLVLTSTMKFLGAPPVVHRMALAGITGEKLMIVATLELITALLFLYPRTRSFGLVFLSAFLGGAISTHVQMGEFSRVVPAGMILALAWLGTCLRHPEALWSFRQNESSAESSSIGLNDTTDRLITSNQGGHN